VFPVRFVGKDVRRDAKIVPMLDFQGEDGVPECTTNEYIVDIQTFLVVMYLLPLLYEIARVHIDYAMYEVFGDGICESIVPVLKRFHTSILKPNKFVNTYGN
jgi:hypothetical protein